MSTLSLRMPASLHMRLRAIAQQEGISINQFVTSAVAEKLAALSTEEYLKARALRGSRENLLDVLTRVPDVQPDPGDEIPEG